MQRQDMKARVRLIMQESQGVPGGQEPFLLDDHITEAANGIARLAKNYHTGVTQALVSGQADYPITSVFQPTRVNALDAPGNIYQLEYISLSDYNAWSFRFLQNNGQWVAGVPSYYCFPSPEKVRVLSVPNYAAANGLTVEGYAYPSFPNPTDACPLPVEAHMAVVWRACLLRAAQFPTPDNQARVKGILDSYASLAKEIGAAADLDALAMSTRGLSPNPAIAAPNAPA